MRAPLRQGSGDFRSIMIAIVNSHHPGFGVIDDELGNVWRHTEAAESAAHCSAKVMQGPMCQGITGGRHARLETMHGARAAAETSADLAEHINAAVAARHSAQDLESRLGQHQRKLPLILGAVPRNGERAGIKINLPPLE